MHINASFGLALEERHIPFAVLFSLWGSAHDRGGLVLGGTQGPNRAERAHGFLKNMLALALPSSAF